MKIEVYHQKINELTAEVVGFEHVANVHVDKAHASDIVSALEYAYRFTNNVDGSWSKKIGLDANDDVEVIGSLPVINGTEYGIRSSSMGDVFKIDDDEYQVAMIGFKKLDSSLLNSPDPSSGICFFKL